MSSHCPVPVAYPSWRRLGSAHLLTGPALLPAGSSLSSPAVPLRFFFFQEGADADQLASLVAGFMGSLLTLQNTLRGVAASLPPHRLAFSDASAREAEASLERARRDAEEELAKGGMPGLDELIAARRRRRGEEGGGGGKEGGAGGGQGVG